AILPAARINGGVPMTEIGDRDFPASYSWRRNATVLLMVLLSLAAHSLLWRYIMQPPVEHAPTSIEEGSQFDAPRIVQESVGPTFAAAFVPLVLSLATILGIAANVY